MISPGRLAEFKAIYRQHYGVDLDDQAALEAAEAVLSMFRVVYRPIPKDSPWRSKDQEL